MAMGGKYRDRHIGNPNLDSEKHTTIELGFEKMLFGNHVNGNIYYNDISDYITTYRASDGTYDNTVNDARIYKNVDANIWGYELKMKRQISTNFSSTLILITLMEMMILKIDLYHKLCHLVEIYR